MKLIELRLRGKRPSQIQMRHCGKGKVMTQKSQCNERLAVVLSVEAGVVVLVVVVAAAVRECVYAYRCLKYGVLKSVCCVT